MLAFKVVVYLSVAIPIMMMDDINAISKKLILAIITSIFILSISKYRLFNKFIKSLMLLCIMYFPFKFILIYNNKNLKLEYEGLLCNYNSQNEENILSHVSC